MSITDELREWASIEVPYKYGHQLLAIADRIDERVKNIRFNEHHKGYQDGIMDGCSHYDPERTECMVSEEHAYIKLPVDADGEVIHAGDKLDGYGKAIEVVELRYGRSGWVLISRDGNAYADTFAFTHHHAPTVEDVLREFAERYLDYEGVPSAGRRGIGEALMDEYAAKLQLREDA